MKEFSQKCKKLHFCELAFHKMERLSRKTKKREMKNALK